MHIYPYAETVFKSNKCGCFEACYSPTCMRFLIPAPMLAR